MGAHLRFASPGLAMRLGGAVACLVAGAVVLLEVADLFGAGTDAIGQAFGLTLIGLGLATAGAVLLAGPLAHLVVEGIASVRTYSVAEASVPLRYLQAELAAREGELLEALQKYQQAVEDGEPELAPYVRMLELAMRDLRDPRRAHAIYLEGIGRLQTEEDRDALQRAYGAVVAQRARAPTAAPPEDGSEGSRDVPPTSGDAPESR